MYIIDKVVVEYSPINDQDVYTIWYRNHSGEYLGLNLALSSSEIHKAYSPEEVLVEAVAKHDPKLLHPMREYLKHASYQDAGKWATLGYTDKPIDFGIKKGTHVEYEFPKYSDHTKHVHFAVDVNKKAYVTGKTNYEHSDVSALPGLNEKVRHPPISNPAAQCGDEARDGTIKGMVMHLNDWHKWTREEIADWLETLDVDLRFKSPDDRLSEQRVEQLSKLSECIVNLEVSIDQWDVQINEAKNKIEEFKAKMIQLQEEQNEQD